MAALDKHVLGLSGGRDSAALAIYMRQHFPELDIEYYFSDTGKELPEVYDFLGKLEAYLGKTIHHLVNGDEKGFDYWLEEYGHFLPSPQTRWCTRQLKIKPFEKWMKREFLDQGYQVHTYIAIRADESYRQGYAPSDPRVRSHFPFRDAGIDKTGVIRMLEDSEVGMPEYYRWRSRSGCSFCFFQRKIEWVRLMREHPDRYEEAKNYEKIAIESGSPFTWSNGESLEELSHPDRIKQIEGDWAKRLERDRKLRRVHPLLPDDPYADFEIDEIYGEDEGGGACLICHK